MTPADLYVGLAKALNYGFSLECSVCATVQCSPPGMNPALAVKYLMMNGWDMVDDQPTCSDCRTGGGRP